MDDTLSSGAGALEEIEQAMANLHDSQSTIELNESNDSGHSSDSRITYMSNATENDDYITVSDAAEAIFLQENRLAQISIQRLRLENRRERLAHGYIHVPRLYQPEPALFNETIENDDHLHANALDFLPAPPPSPNMDHSLSNDHINLLDQILQDAAEEDNSYGNMINIVSPNHAEYNGNIDEVPLYDVLHSPLQNVEYHGWQPEEWSSQPEPARCSTPQPGPSSRDNYEPINVSPITPRFEDTPRARRERRSSVIAYHNQPRNQTPYYRRRSDRTNHNVCGAARNLIEATKEIVHSMMDVIRERPQIQDNLENFYDTIRSLGMVLDEYSSESSNEE